MRMFITAVIVVLFLAGCWISYEVGKRNNNSVRDWEQGIVDAKRAELLSRFPETMYFADHWVRWLGVELYQKRKGKGDPIISQEEMEALKEAYDEIRKDVDKNPREFNRKIAAARDRLPGFFDPKWVRPSLNRQSD